MCSNPQVAPSTEVWDRRSVRHHWYLTLRIKLCRVVLDDLMRHKDDSESEGHGWWAGVEGVMRRCCEETMRVLRANKEALLTLIEVTSTVQSYKSSFLYDSPWPGSSSARLSSE